MSDNSKVPRWLSALLTEKFFNSCVIHDDQKKNEKNVFCFDCCVGICPYCLLHHRSHRLLQIRRYMYHDVVKIKEAEKLMDCAKVQCHIINSAKVVFLNRRPPTKPCKSCTTFCVNCDKSLQDSNIFCCLYCKLQHLLSNGSKLSRFLRNYDFPVLSEPDSDDGQLTPDSGPVRAESGSSGNHGLLISAATDITRKKRSTHLTGARSMFRPACAPVSEHCYSESEAIMNRRKGTPQRSPLY